MRVFRFFGSFISWLWTASRRSWVNVGLGLIPRSPASGLVLFLFCLFFLIGLVLVLLGFDLGEVDAWIERQIRWLDAIGSWLFRAICGLVILLCALMFVLALVDRKNPERPGWGCLITALIVGYFAWFGLIGD